MPVIRRGSGGAGGIGKLSVVIGQWLGHGPEVGIESSCKHYRRTTNNEPLHLCYDRRNQPPNPRNLRFELVAWFQKGAGAATHSPQRSGGDDISRLQRDDARNERDHRGDGKNLLARRSMLPDFAVES